MQDVSNHIIGEVFSVEQRVEFLCLLDNVDLQLRIEYGTEVVQTYYPVRAGGIVDEPMGDGRYKIDLVVPDRPDVVMVLYPSSV